MTLVEKLVYNYSPSGQENNAVAVLLEELRFRGFKAQKDQAGNAIGITGSGPVRVYLAGHIDTVPGEIPVKVENNILYGRGSVDAKAALAGFVEAASAFQNSDVLTISVIGCIAEETDSKGARYIFDTFAPPQYAKESRSVTAVLCRSNTNSKFLIPIIVVQNSLWLNGHCLFTRSSKKITLIRAHILIVSDLL